MISYLITEGSFSFNYSQIFENAHCIANTNEYILNPNEIIDISKGILLNTNNYLFLKIDPELEEYLDIIGKDHFELKEKIHIRIKNKSNNAIKIAPYHPLIHIVSCNCLNYKFTLIASQINLDVEQTIDEIIDNVADINLSSEVKVDEVEPVEQVKADEVEQVEEIKADEVEPVAEVKADEVEPVAEVKDDEVEPVAEVKADEVELVEEIKADAVEPVAEVKADEVEPVAEVKADEVEPVEQVKIEADSGSEVKHDDIIKKRKYIRKKRV